MIPRFTRPLAFLLPFVLFGPESRAQAPSVFEPSPILSASAILRPEYDRGLYFQVRDPVPTYGGDNAYTIDSAFGVFEAEGNTMLMRRVAEINAIAILSSASRTEAFRRAAEKAAASPLVAARELITHPVGTISGVPRGVWKFLNQTGQTVKEIGQGRPSDPADGGAAAQLLGFAKVKRTISLNLGVDPYSANPVYQAALNQVAWPAFAGGFTIDVGLAVATSGLGNAGLALSAVGWTGDLNTVLREDSPADLRLKNLGLLLAMGVTRPDAVTFLNNNALSPTTQTILVDALSSLAGAAGRDDFVRQAATSADEHEALFYQQCAQLMARVQTVDPLASVSLLEGLPVCQAADGRVVVPLQWDYVAWTPMAARFVETVQGAKFPRPVTGYNLVLTGVVSPMAATELARRKIGISQKQLATPLR